MLAVPLLALVGRWEIAAARCRRANAPALRYRIGTLASAAHSHAEVAMADERLADPLSDEEKKHRLTRGLPLRFTVPAADQPELPEHRAARTIQASWLEDLSTQPEAMVKVAILLEHAVIEGPLRLRYATFLQEVA